MQSYVPVPVDGHPQIKREPGTDGPYHGSQGSNQPYMQAMNPALAQQRAASLLQQQFGSQANASLGAMQQRGISLPGQQKPPGNLQLPGQPQQNPQQQYAQQMKQQAAAQQNRIKTEDGQPDQKPYTQNGLSYAQTDGSGDAMDDWRNLVKATRALSGEQIAKNDNFMRDQIAESSRSLESGLMLPMSQQKRSSKSRKAHVRQASRAVGGSTALSTIPQLDGELDDDEDDENAINSDLDDDDDEAANAEEDDDDMDSMLCTYDKVQRVKNKWKCTLKDGVLSANGKE